MSNVQTRPQGQTDSKVNIVSYNNDLSKHPLTSGYYGDSDDAKKKRTKFLMDYFAAVF
jgi:hypothetical protein